MNRTVVQHTTAAAVSVGLAALIVAVESHLTLPPLAYLSLVGLGVIASATGVYVADIEWPICFSLWVPWGMILLFDPTTPLAYGLLTGAVVGLLAVPVMVKMGDTANSLAS